MVKVYLSLGSNMGNRVSNINKAVSILKTTPEICCVESSGLYETEPVGYKEQDHFLNCAVALKTTLEPMELLRVCQDIEKKMKRVRLFRWGPRIIDVDILLYGDLTISSRELTIPHPRMYERSFVLTPLCDLDSSFRSFLDKLEDQGVRIYNQSL